MRRFGLLLFLVVACGDDSDGDVDAAVDAAMVDASDPDTGTVRDTGPPCELSCGFGESCCIVDDEPQCLDTNNDPLNCGGCGVDCSEGRGTECDRGRCICGNVDIGCGGNRNSWCCPPRDEQPTDYCANFDTDANDCGECGSPCDPRLADRCDGGRCYCGLGRDVCEGTPESLCCPTDFETRCVDTTSDVSHCGGCDRRCQLSERCEEGSCARGAGMCPGGCEGSEICCGGSCCARALCNGTMCEEPPDAGADGGVSDAAVDSGVDASNDAGQDGGS